MSKGIRKAQASHYTDTRIMKISLITVCVLALVAIGVSAIILPKYTVEKPPVNKQIEAIVPDNDGLIGVGADLSQVYVTVKYTDGTQSKFSLKEALPSGLDTSKEQLLENVVLNIGGYQQRVTYKVVSPAKKIEYVAGQGGIIRGDTSQRVFAGYDATTVVAVPDEGYEFLRWSDGNPRAERTDRQVSRDMVITATFQKKKYTVVFYYPDGTTAREEIVFHNESPTRAPRAEEPQMYKYGHVLVGWSEDYTHITKDTNIYPIYEKFATDIYLSFTQDKEGRPLGFAKDLKAYYPKTETSIIRIEPNPYRSFKGWSIQAYDRTEFLDKEGGEVNYAIGSPNNFMPFVAARTGASEEYTLTFTPTAITEELYITAVFEYNSSTITFSSMGITLPSIELEAGVPIGREFNVWPELYFDEDTRDDYLESEECPDYLKEPGYLFKGWYVAGTPFNPETGYPVRFVSNEDTFATPTSLIAFWEKKVFTVVFMKADNEDSEFRNIEWYNPKTGRSETFYDDDRGGLVLTILYQDPLGGPLTGVYPGREPYKAYHNFVGWYVADSGGAATDELVDHTYKVTKNINVVPVFRVIQKTLNISVRGSGSVVRMVNGAENDVPGTFRMDATGDYRFRFKAGDGYHIESITVNGAPLVITGGEEGDPFVRVFEYAISSPVLEDYEFVVNFEAAQATVTINNVANDKGERGRIKYDDELGFSTLAEIKFSVNIGQSKLIWIIAPENYRIYNLRVSGVPITDLGQNEYSYTLVLDNIRDAVTVEVEYRPIELRIDLPTGMLNGTISYEAQTVNMGTSPFVAFEANPGYYIKNLTVNGVRIDPYHPPAGILVSQLESVSSETDRPIENDMRVTTFVLVFELISSDKNIDVEFAPVYYYVNVTKEGVGNVSFTNLSVAKGSTIYVAASTSPTYYIYAYSYTNPSADTTAPGYVNEIETVMSSVSQDVNIMLENIERDVYVNVEFRRCRYTVNFANTENGVSGEFASITYLDNEISVTKRLPYTLEMEALTSRVFTVNAAEGYIIESILVQTEQQVRDSAGGIILGEWLSVSFNAKSHTIALDNIETGYSVTVNCRIATYDVKLWVVNARGDVYIDGVEAAYLATTLTHGDLYTVTVYYNSESDHFAPSNLYAESPDTVRAVVPQSGTITLEIERVTGDAEIFVVLEPPVPEDEPGYGQPENEEPQMPLNYYNVVLKADPIRGTLTARRETTIGNIKVMVDITDGLIEENGKLELTALPVNNNYILKQLAVNGRIVTPSANGVYRIEGVSSDIYAEAIFEPNELPVILDLRNTHGMLSASANSFVYGDLVTIRIVAATGYKVSYVAIGSRSNPNILSNVELDKFNSAGPDRITDYVVDTMGYTYAEMSDGLYVSVEFAPLTFSLSVTINGNGGVSDEYEVGKDRINYGTYVDIPIEADENHFISYIKVNGIVYDPFELNKRVIDGSIQKCIAGELRLLITQNTVIEIGFSPNVYGVTIVSSWGGTTLVRTEGGIYSDGNGLELYAGQNLEIYMQADKSQGTHISALYINGQLIRPEEWKLDLYSPNNNRSITYQYKGPAGNGITGNVHIRVVYEINEYTIIVKLKNKSLNFRDVHINNTSFGSVNLSNFSPFETVRVNDTDEYLMTVQTYKGIPHGTPIRFQFLPERYDGYIIDYDTAAITYYDPNDTTSSEPKVLPLRSLVNNDMYILPALNFDIQSVYVEFIKEKYTYSLSHEYNSMGSVYIPEVERPISIEFSNPYSPGKEVIVERINNVEYYERGLDFVVRCVPGDGYSITAFSVNGNGAALSSLRNNNYTGRLTNDISIAAVYTITTHRVSFTTNLSDSQINSNIGQLAIYSSDNILLWKPGMASPVLPIQTPDGVVVGFNQNYITVTYNTVVKFAATPNYNSYGYKIDYLTIDNSQQYISNPDTENTAQHIVKGQTRGHVSFSIHYYLVSIAFFDGGSAMVAGNATVPWDSDCTVIVNIYAGYKLNAILVNGTADAALLANARRTTLNDASTQYEITLFNIKSDKALSMDTERIPYDMTFDGGFMESFEVLDYMQDSVTGIVVNEGRAGEAAYFSKPSAWPGSNPLQMSTVPTDQRRYVYSGFRYKDSVTIYFMPIDGYKIKNVTVTMRTVRGVVNTIVNSVDALTLYDPRYGHYYYRISEATGAITVTVNYEIKTYNVTMSTSGRGNISKVEVNNDTQTGSTVVIPRTVNHYDRITIEFTADYGYHLENLVINGRTISDVQYEKVSRVIEGAPRLVYRYTTDTSTGRMIIDSLVINGRPNFTVSAEFDINTFPIRTFINGVETDFDIALALSLSNSRMEFNSNFTIFQQITEGYSITDITIKSAAGQIIAEYVRSNPAHESILKSPQLTFVPSGNYIDYLDYHDFTGTGAILYVYYNTVINTHTSVINTYLYEYEKVGNDYVLVSDPYGVPMVEKITTGGVTIVPAYSLTRTFNNIVKDNNAIHNYNVEARFRFFMDPAASEKYVFAGYQVYENGAWRYINEGDSGFVLSSNSVSPTGEPVLDTLEYTIKSDKEFRAVVYRVYEVKVEVHPQFKWQSGSLSLTNFNMEYVTYANLTATATFAPNMNPNLPSNQVTLADIDGVQDAKYTFKVYCGARLNLTVTDSKASINPVTSTSYYDITYSASGKLTQTQRTYGILNTVVINSDRLVHAYANNDRMHLDVALETQGEAVGSEGGSVKYYTYNEATGQYISKSLTGSYLAIPTNTVVMLEITPKISYAIDGVYMMESSEQAVNGKQVFMPDSWLPIETKSDGTVEVSRPNDDGPLYVVMRLIENTIIKVKFWKQMQVTSSINVLYGDAERTITESEASDPNSIFKGLWFTNRSADKIYDYEDDIHFAVPNFVYSDRWDIRYQFVGFFVNGVNSYQQLDSGYPDSTSVTYRLYNYDPVYRADGVTMVRNSANEMFKVNIVAKFVLVFNITFVNEYTYNIPGGETVYFNPGYFSADYIPYSPEAPLYYTEQSYIWAKTAAGEHTDYSIQMFAKINRVSVVGDNRESPTSAYNTWSDNFINVKWYRDEGENPNAVGFIFIEWQYWAYDGSGWKWMTLPDTNLADQNKPTNTEYRFSVSSLFPTSYFSHVMNPVSVSMYDDNGDYDGNKSIYTIMIRPRFQRIEDISIQKVVYTQSYGIPDESAANQGPASIEESGATSGTYNYYDVVTLKPGTRSGFRFLGWYYSSTGLESDYILVTHADASSPMTPTRNYQLVGYEERDGQVIYGGDLKVRLVRNTVVKAVYIKIWNITVRAFNESGDSALMKDSVPILAYYGVAQTVNGQEVYSDSPELISRREKPLVLQAGEKVKFKLNFSQGSFNSEYDYFDAINVYKSGILQSWVTTAEAANSVNIPIKGESSRTALESAELIIIANDNKTIEIVFRTYGKLQINNIYPMSSVVLPDAFYQAMYQEHGSTNNWNINSIADNGPVDMDSRPGYMLITGIPIKKEGHLTYDGVFKNKLPSMSGNYALEPRSVTTFGINFSGAWIGNGYNKAQTITFFNTVSGGSDGMAQMDMPFYVNGSTYGRGTSDSPFLISTVNHLRSIDIFIASNGNTASGVYFKLNNDLDITSLLTTGATQGIGTESKPFDGIFDGGGRNMYFNSTVTISGALNSLGIFRYTRNATISNIRIGQASNSTLSATSSSIVGYLVGTADSTIIENITTQAGRISISGISTVGGLVGQAKGSTVIRNSTISCNINITATNSSVGIAGGVAGFLDGSSRAENIDFTTTVTVASDRYAGAIAGKAEGQSSVAVDNCRTYLPRLNNTAVQAIGGLVGYIGANRRVQNSYIKTETQGVEFYSGILNTFNASSTANAEQNGGGLIAGINRGSIYNCYVSNLTVTAYGSFFGGIVGVNFGTVQSSYTQYVKITVDKNRVGSGGIYGGIAGYNAGTVTGCTLTGWGNQSLDFTNVNFLIKSHTYNSDPFQTGGIDPAGKNIPSDGGYIYLGGMSGYNAGGGVITNTVSNGAKMLVNRWSNNNVDNYTYVGIVTGYNGSGNSQSTGNRMTNSSAQIYLCVAVDNGSTAYVGKIAYAYVGDLYGFNQSGSLGQSGSGGNKAHLTAICIGSYMIPWQIYASSPVTTNSKEGRDASGYQVGQLRYQVNYNSSYTAGSFTRALTNENLHASGVPGRETGTNWWWKRTGSFLGIPTYSLQEQTVYRNTGKLRFLRIV